MSVEPLPPSTAKFGTEEFIGQGEARARKDDRFNEKVGKGIALGRALQDAGRALEEKWLARSVCEADLQARRGKASLEEEFSAELEQALQDQIDLGYQQHIEEMRGRSMEEILGRIDVLILEPRQPAT